MDANPKKRKRETDTPRITYSAGGRTFERLFKEESLEETKDVVRRKLGLGPGATIGLAQFRDGTSIDLEDEDDFEAFYAHAHTTQSVHVTVSSEQGSAWIAQSSATPASSMQPSREATAARAEQQLPSLSSRPMTQPAEPSAAVASQAKSARATVNEPKAKRRKVANPKVQDSPTKDPEPQQEKPASAAPVAGEPKPKRRKKKANTGELDSNTTGSTTPTAADSVGQVALPGAVSVVPSAAEAAVPTPVASSSAATKIKKTKKTNPVAPVDPSAPAEPVTGSTDAIPSSKKPKATKTPRKAADKVAPSNSDAAAAADAPPQVTATKKPRAKKSTQEVPVAAESNPVPSARKKGSKTAKTAAVAGVDAPSTTNPDAMDVDADTQPSKDAVPASEPVVPVNGKVKKQKKQKSTPIAAHDPATSAAVAAATQRVLARSAQVEPPVANDSALTPSTADQETGTLSSTDGAQEVSTATIARSPFRLPRPPRLTKPKTKEVPCPICGNIPFHLRFLCPIVLAGSDSMEKRLQEMLSQPNKHLPGTIEDLKMMLDRDRKAKFKRPGVPATNSASTKPSAQATSSTISRPLRPADDSDSDSDSDGSTVTAPRKILAAPPVIASSAVSDDVLEAIIRGPQRRRMLASDFMSPSPSDTEAPEKVVLEEDEQAPKRPKRRKGRAALDASDSSSDERADDGTADVPDDTSLDQDVDSTLVSFREVDDMGSSIPMDTTADDLLSDAMSVDTTVARLAAVASVPIVKSTAVPTGTKPPSRMKSQLTPLETNKPSSSRKVITSDDNDTIESANTSVEQPLLTSPIEFVDARNPINMPPPPVGSSPLARRMRNRQGLAPSKVSSIETIDDSSVPKASPSTQPATSKNADKVQDLSRPPASQPAGRVTRRLSSLAAVPRSATDILAAAGLAQKTPSKAPARRKPRVVVERHTPESEENMDEAPLIVPPASVGESQVTEQSMATWETLDPSSSPQPDSTVMEDELQYPSPGPVTSTPLPASQSNDGFAIPDDPVKSPLFVLTESQRPFPYSQWQDTQVEEDVLNGAEIQDEEEVAAAVHSLRSPSATSTAFGAYRKLSDIASQAVFPTPSLIKAPILAPPTKATLDDLYGLSQREEEEETDSGSDSDTAVPSHIPAARRAGAAAKK
ncbi:hypothetical protein HGRIS_002596 [Hohenbuehelia grisea]|uniref:Uncharacterized protein n=1 Tax=Hohenbuehelia grisea TaxID=104357 RepID=A0ABR3JKZ3_9AGAR